MCRLCPKMNCLGTGRNIGRDILGMASLSTQTILFLLSLQFVLIVSEDNGQREFDYFALALQWPGTVCQRTRHCCSSNACCRR